MLFNRLESARNSRHECCRSMKTILMVWQSRYLEFLVDSSLSKKHPLSAHIHSSMLTNNGRALMSCSWVTCTDVMRQRWLRHPLDPYLLYALDTQLPFCFSIITRLYAICGASKGRQRTRTQGNRSKYVWKIEYVSKMTYSQITHERLIFAR